MFLHKLPDSSWRNSYAIFFSIGKIPSSLCSKCIFFTNLHSLSRSQFYSPRSTSFLAIYPFAVHFRVWSCIAMLVASFWWKPEQHLFPTLFFSGACSQHLYCQKFILLSLMVLNKSLSFWWLPPGKQTVCYRTSPFLNRSVNINQLSTEVFSTGNCQSLPAGKAKPGL